MTHTVILCSALLSLFSASLQADVIRLRADEWYPINGQPDSEKPGYMIEIARTIWEAAGHQVEYRLMPWERAIDETRQGRAECIVGAYREDAPDFVFPQQAMGLDSSHFYVAAANSWRFQTMADLNNVRLGTIGGYAYDNGELDAYIEKNQKNPARVQIVRSGNALEQNIRKLLTQRIDVIVESPAVMQAQLKKMEHSDAVVSAGMIGEQSPLYIACSPVLPAVTGYLDLLDNGLQEMHNNGRLQTILKRYGLDDWQ
ncbi:MAG: transporter substrate-binding domain-containing protein [Saccharospirillaceae bacterium]|nr:transporter substrate-binding domain-containing protein [Saccharospirillaceae bacterium]MCD8531572.1 transporter substrate-binding domain-containing protein [Saccharospirillaceae bacterium]